MADADLGRPVRRRDAAIHHAVGHLRGKVIKPKSWTSGKGWAIPWICSPVPRLSFSLFGSVFIYYRHYVL